VLVVDDYRLHGFQRNVNDVLDIVKALVSGCLASGLLKVKSEVLNTPLLTMLSIILF
jgi:hypothetical protein